MRISIVVAQAHDRVIGRDGQLPWRLPGDLQRFKRLTMGHPLIMGRKTLESIGRLLPGRTTIVLTRDPAFDWPGAHIAHTWEQAVSLAAESCRAAGDVDEAFVVGGAEIYQLALPDADRIYLTEVDSTIEGADTYFPQLDPAAWTEIHRESYPAGPRDPFPCTVRTLDRSVG